MQNFVIVPDSNSDMPKELRSRFKIEDPIKSFIVFPDGHSEKVGCDWDCISQDKYYELIKSKKNKFSTAAVSPEQFEQEYEKYLKEGKDVLSIILSSKLSSTYNYAYEASLRLKEKYPERKVLVIDSKRYSTSEMLLLIYASNLRDEGNNIDETFAKLEEIKYHLHQAGPMDDLLALARAGRISNGKAFMGQLIGVNPIGEVSREGITSVLCKVKGSKAALRVSLEYMKRTIIDPEKQIIVIANSNRKEKAELYRQMIEREVQPKEIIMTDVGLATVPNIGPGLCAAYYYGNELTESLEAERKIFAKITGKE